MRSVFVDRERELKVLDRAHSRGGQLVVVYGRRRVGKTRLLLEWLRGKRHVYYLAGPWPHERNLEELARKAGEQLGLEALGQARFQSLDALLSLMVELVGASEKLVVVIDEFTYWARGWPGVVGELQRFVDTLLPRTRATIVVSGSLTGIMEREVIGVRAPLFGRAGARIRLEPLPLPCTRPFAPGYGEAELLALYALVGGVPLYLDRIDTSKPPLEAYLELFAPGGVLEDEPLLSYREEFRDPTPYTGLLREIAARGPLTLGKAAKLSHLPTSHASRYLQTLVLLGLVEPLPLLGSRRRLYRARDRLINSWYKLVEPHYPDLARGQRPPGLNRAYQALLAEEWERTSQQDAAARARVELGVEPQEQGLLMHRGVEVDWLLIDHTNKTLVPVEAKWSDLTPLEAQSTARSLINRTLMGLPRRMASDYEVKPMIYAKSCRNCTILGATVVELTDLPWRECRVLQG